MCAFSLLESGLGALKERLDALLLDCERNGIMPPIATSTCLKKTRMDHVTTSALSQLEAAWGRVESLKAGLDSVSQTIQLHKASIHAQFSPIALLPAEILSHVFSMLIVEDFIQSNADNTRAVSQVSRFWRTAAIGHSALWTDPNADWNPKWIKVYLSRSGTRPLNIRFYAHSRYINTLTPYAERWASLRVSGPTFFAPFSNLIDRILRPVASHRNAILEKLFLVSKERTPLVYTTFPLRIPSLRKLYLYQITILDLSTISEGLTSLSLRGLCPTQEVALMLVSSPHLRQLNIRGGYCGKARHVALSRTPNFCFPSLERLMLSRMDDRIVELLSSIQIPTLKTLIFPLSSDCIHEQKIVRHVNVKSAYLTFIFFSPLSLKRPTFCLFDGLFRLNVFLTTYHNLLFEGHIAPSLTSSKASKTFLFRIYPRWISTMSTSHGETKYPRIRSRNPCEI